MPYMDWTPNTVSVRITVYSLSNNGTEKEMVGEKEE